jgi:hypothetical protein
MPKRSRSSRKTKPSCAGKEKNWKSWNSNINKPGTKKQRSNLKQKCGAQCFGDAKNLKYPLCRSNCSFDRAALLSAKILGTHHGHYNVVNKASRKLKSCNRGKKAKKGRTNRGKSRYGRRL